MTFTRILMALAAALAAANAALAALPGDVISNDLAVIVGVLNAGVAAMAAFLSKAPAEG